MEYIIYNKNGEQLTTVKQFEYSDTDMGTCSVSMTIKSPVPIDFSNGDYLIFRNEKFTLNYMPSVKKQARKETYGEAFVYDNLIFNSCRDELTRCMFYDIVQNDNKIPYTNLPTVTFTDSGLKQIQMRVQANLDRVYGEGAWIVSIQNDAKRRDGGEIRDYNYSFSNQSVWEVLAQVSQCQDISFTVRNYYEENGVVVNKRVIVLAAIHNVVSRIYKYGKGNGFKSIEAQSSESEQVMTELHVYGNSTNMPYRYYNHLVNGGVYDKDSKWADTHPLASLYMPNLCLPGFATAPTAGTQKYYNRDLTTGSASKYDFVGWVTFYDGDFNKVSDIDDASFAFVQRGEVFNNVWYVKDTYLHSVRSFPKYGQKEGNKDFNSDDDENGYDDIYPSAKWLMGTDGKPLARVTVGCEIADDGIPNEAGTIDTANFEITIANVGFNVRDDKYGADSVPQIMMTSGMCTSRAFDINSCEEVKDDSGNVVGYKLVCVRTKDDAIDRYFPYNDYPIKADDTFAFLNIQMPNEYVAASSEQLLKEGLLYLSAHDSNTIVLKPELDNIFLATEEITEDNDTRLADVLCSGLGLNIMDDDVTINTPVNGLTISELRISVGKSLIDEYEITLASEKEADMVSRIVKEVKNYFTSGSGMGGNMNNKTYADIIKQVGKKIFLSRKEADTAEGAITFEQGLTAIAQNGGGKVAGDGVVEGDGTVPESNEVAVYSGIVEYAGGGGGASTLGELDNVAEEADSVDAENDWVLVKLAGSAQWTLKKMSELGNGGTGDSILRLTAEDTDITVAVGYTANIKFNFSSIDSYTQEPTGDGTMTIYVNNERKTSYKIKQGDNTVDVQSWINAGENYVTVEVTDVFGAKKKLEFTVTALSISISSTFNAYQIYDSSIPFYYTPFGSFKKTVYFKIDGAVIHREDTSISNRELSYTIPKQSHGSHLLEVYCTTTVEDTVIESNHLIYDLLCIEEGNTATVIACYYGDGNVKQYSSVAVPYMVYRSASITTDVDLYVDGVLVNSLLVDRTRQTWNYRCDKEGEHTFRIQAGSTYKEFTLTVAGSEIDIQPETANLELYLSSINRSNQQKDRDVWEYGGYRANFSGFNWSSDGWVADDNNDTVLRVINGASVDIPMKIFGEDFKSAGKTIEFEFCTRNIIDYSVPVITCINNGKGFQLTAQECMFSAESTSITTQFKEEERVRISFVVDKKSQKRLIYCYINGIVSAVAQYPADDNFAQNVPQPITIGSDKCGIDIYNIRVYSNNLNMYQMLDNYIYDMSDVDRKLAVFRRNQIFDDYGEFLESKINEQLPIMYIIGDLPQYKGDKKNNKIRYKDDNDPTKNFTVETVQNNVQGTSSQYYVRKNYKWKAKTPFIMYDGTEQSKYKFRDECIAVNCFCLKADYAESSSTHNTGFAKLIDATLKKLKFLTPPQKENSVIRTTVDGFPIVVYHQATEDATPTFLGKYNFNNDKSTSDVYGFTDGDECWEFLNNTSDRCLFLASEFDAVDDDGNPVWLNDFEARYPDLDDPYKDCTHLKALCDWIVSCKGNPDKFKAEVEDWFDLDFLLFYYLFTEIFAMVDQRAKNMMFYYCAKDGKWRPIFYDNDTILGLNNEGAIAFSYNVEYHDKIGTQNVYNGEASTLFNLIEQCMYTEIQTLYTNMRSQGYLSYDVVVEFLDEQEAQKWCESIYNYDMKFKYIDPLDDGDASNLFRLQGSREQHRKWWLYNRMRYMDSKYNAGDFKQDYATLRLYTPSDYAGVEPNANFTVIPYSDEYVGVKYGSYFKISRAEKNVPITIVAPDIVFNDTETIIYGASSLLDLGDLSPLYSGTIDVTRCVKLTTLNIGSDAEGYQNTNLTDVSVGANTMLQRINVMNCPNLSNTLDLSRCPNMQEVYCEGTAIRSVSLKAGTPIKVLHLSSEVTNLTFTDITTLTDLSIPSYDNITTIKIENSPSVDELSILKNTLYKDPLKLERLRLTGVSWKLDNSDFLMDLYNNSKTGGGSIYGINEFNENVNDIQLTGDAELKVVYAGDEDKIQSLFPYLNLIYDTVLLKFEDPEFEKALVNWFKQTSVGGITKEFAESVTDTNEDGWNNVICKNYDVTSAKGYSKFTNLKKIQGTFNGKTKLTYIEFPPNLVTLGDRSFLGVAATHDIIVPNSVETVGSYVFQSTKSSTIIMGQNVKSIGNSIINTSSALKNFVIITATPPTLGGIGWSLPKAFCVYVPSASYDAYKAADEWKTYAISKLENADADLRAKVNNAYGTNY